MKVSKMKKVITVIFIIIAVLAISFFSTAGLIKLACWAFNYTFSWKLSVGIWVVLWLLGSVFKSSK